MFSFHFPERFPETCRAFADGELSLVMDRYGGILEMALIDVLHLDGRDYGDNYLLPLLSRRAGMSSNRPLYGPAVQFLSLSADGQISYHEPASPVVYPWGVMGRAGDNAFGMLLDRQRALFRFTNRDIDRKRLIASISRLHFWNGKFYSCKNQRTGDGCERHCQKAGVSFDPTKPVPNGEAESTWSDPVVRDEKNAVIWHGHLRYPYGEKELYLAFSFSEPVQLTTQRSLWVITADWADQNPLYAVLAVGNTEEDVLNKVSCGGTDFPEVLSRKKNCGNKWEKKALTANISGMPAAQDFLKAAPGYTESMLLHNMTGIRAAQHKFAHFMMWDTLYPIRDLLWAGQFAKAKAIFRTFLGYPYIENSAWIVSQLFLVLDEILSFDPDPDFEAEAWPWMKQYLDFQLHLTDPETGLVASSMTTGVDVPQELGLSGLYNAPCINGWWYGGLRVMENLAVRHGEQALQHKLAELTARIEKYFVKGFLSKDAGYLRSGINTDLSVGKIEAFQNTSTIGLDYPFGRYLLRDVYEPLATYQAKKLYHPEGHTAVAWNTQIDCEMWKSVHMNQHIGHETLLQRLVGNMKEAKRIVSRYLGFFETYGCAIETFNYSGCAGNEGQTGDWQLFSATAASEAIRSGIAGIARHRGGFFYTPADDDVRITMRQFRWQKTEITLEITGKGKFFMPMQINNRMIPGTAQIPTDRLCGKSLVWKIRRTDDIPDYPVLLNTFGLPVESLNVTGNVLSFRAGEAGHYPLDFYAERPLSIRKNGIVWKAERLGSHVFVDIMVSKGDTIEVSFTNPQ